MPDIEIAIRSVTYEDCNVAHTAYTKLDEFLNTSSNVGVLTQLEKDVNSLVDQFGETIVIYAILHKLIGDT